MGRSRWPHRSQRQRSRTSGSAGSAGACSLARRTRCGQWPSASPRWIRINLVCRGSVPWARASRCKHQPCSLAPAGAGPSRRHMGPYADPPGSRAGWSQRESLWHSGRQRRLSSLTGSSTLEASSLQHLLVLLLTHALAALLNERSHGGATVAVRRALVRNDTTPGGSVQGGLGIPIR